MRWVKSDKYEKRARKALTLSDRQRADRMLDRLSDDPPPASINLRPMEGHNGVLWEMKAGGQNRFILRRCKDEVGDYFLVEDVGPHDIYNTWNAKR